MSNRPGRPHPSGRYRYLRGGSPYSSGVAAEPGFRVERIQFEHLLPWRGGFDRIDRYLSDVGEPRESLCAIELRCPSPYTIDGFKAYNETYCDVLRSWEVYDGDENPIARTNVAPSLDPPDEQTMHAFSCAVPDADAADEDASSFVIAGGGEVASPELTRQAIIRCGETTEDAIGEKGTYVVNLMAKRLEGLGFAWDDVRETNVYTVHPIDRAVVPYLLERMGRASRHGINQIPSRPPIVDIEYEMDLRSVARQVAVS